MVRQIGAYCACAIIESRHSPATTATTRQVPHLRTPMQTLAVRQVVVHAQCCLPSLGSSHMQSKRRTNHSAVIAPETAGSANHLLFLLFTFVRNLNSSPVVVDAANLQLSRCPGSRCTRSVGATATVIHSFILARVV